MRRQTAPRPGQRELQVLDYDNVQQTLVPMIARSYALQFMVRCVHCGALWGQQSSARTMQERGALIPVCNRCA